MSLDLKELIKFFLIYKILKFIFLYIRLVNLTKQIKIIQEETEKIISDIDIIINNRNNYLKKVIS